MLSAMLATLIGVFQPAPCALENVPDDFEQKNALECGWVAVPLRKDAFNGRTIRLWTARIRATSSARLDDSILYINGGPGIATVDAILPNIAEIKSLSRLRQTRDIILFDQRGSGRSEDSLCPKLAESLNAIEAQGLAPADEDARSRAAYAACRTKIDKAGLDIEAYTTRATVADMDSLRQAFGVEKWNLLSISYGSLVAMDAMRVSPGSIRSVILNSPYPPNSVTWAEQASSAAAAYTAIDRECAAQPACSKRHGSLLPKLEATLARLERTPVQDGKTRITGRLFASGLWPMAVRSNTVKFVPLAIDRAFSGDEETIKKVVAKNAGGDSFGGYSPGQALAISCFESGLTTEWYRRARRLYPALVSSAPDDGWDQLCAVFRPGFADPTFFAPVASNIPTLIYAGSLDPATPTVDAYQAMRFLTNVTLVEVPGTSHGPMGVDECTLGIATAFLDNPVAPPDRRCMATRNPMQFASEGLDELLAPAVADSPAAGRPMVDAASTPPDPISGAPAVRLLGFVPGTEVEISFTRAAPDGKPPAFGSSARYRVAADGSVDVSSAPLSGDWKASDVDAPFWSMQPDANVPVPAPDTVLIRAQGNGAHAQLEYVLPQSAPVAVESVQEFAGAFLVRPAATLVPLPLVIVLGGSEGDDIVARQIAPQLAAQGYAALGLPYRSPDREQGQAIPGLPSIFSEIPVDRLEQVHQWALRDSRVDSRRIGLWGVSKGAEFAIIAAANYEWLDAVAAIVPSDVVWEGFGSGKLERTGTASFSLQGKPLSYVPYGEPGRRRNSKDSGRRQHPQAVKAARVPIERFRGLLLVAGSGQDQTWDSAGMSQAISEHRAEHGLPTVSLIFPDASHGLVGGLLDPVETAQGGTVEGIGQARKAVWAETLKLFKNAWPPEVAP